MSTRPLPVPPSNVVAPVKPKRAKLRIESETNSISNSDNARSQSGNNTSNFELKLKPLVLTPPTLNIDRN